MPDETVSRPAGLRRILLIVGVSTALLLTLAVGVSAAVSAATGAGAEGAPAGFLFLCH